MAILGRWVEPVYALFRVVSGLLFAQHGAQKLFGVLEGQRATEPLMMVAGVIEFFGGLLIAVGLLTSIVALLASGQMAVAYFMAHAPQGPWPILNGGELAALFCFVFLYVAARGGGPYSLDATMDRGRTRVARR